MLERLHQLETNISELHSLKKSYNLEDIKEGFIEIGDVYLGKKVGKGKMLI